MTPSNSSSLVVSAGIVALISWRMYWRIRRMVGRQKLSRVRPWLTVFFFPSLAAVLLLNPSVHPASALALFCGAALGTGLGLYGLRLTKFEESPSGLFYTPNAHLGIVLSLLLLCRIVYRFAQEFLSGAPLGVPPSGFVRSPLTLMIFGALTGYYVAYAIGLLGWRRRVAAGAHTPAGPWDT